VDPDPDGLRSPTARLLELARVLDGPVAAEPQSMALVALAQRARVVFRAHRQVALGGAAAAAPQLLRPLLEIEATVRALAGEPGPPGCSAQPWRSPLLGDGRFELGAGSTARYLAEPPVDGCPSGPSATAAFASILGVCSRALGLRIEEQVQAVAHGLTAGGSGRPATEAGVASPSGGRASARGLQPAVRGPI
jgi:hypothetical protein